MSQPVPSASPPPAPPDALRLVLFGLPAAGKTSLLGALGQAARTQAVVLGGVLMDESHQLEALIPQVYEETPRRTLEEVHAYPVRFVPGPRNLDEKQPSDVTLLDCDGSVVNDLLARRDELPDDSPEGSLAGEVVRADGIILAIDAASPRSQVQSDFTAFARFLQTLQRSRGERTEVAGLPVFLVLTKCDLLAQPGDSMATWIDRIEARKREVDQHFRQFLAEVAAARKGEDAKKAAADAKKEEPSPFGRLDVHVWATAIKRPPLAGSPPRPHDPYGVAELFRQGLSEARDYRRARDRSQRRLVGLVAAVSGLVVTMAALTAGLWLSALDSRAALLRARVEDFRSAYAGPPAERLRGAPEALRDRIQRLEAIRDDDQFERLPAELQVFVTARLDELNAYVPYFEKLLAEPPPTQARTEAVLERSLQRYRDELALPDPEWADTLAGQLHRQRLEATEALRRAVLAVRNWYLDSSDQATRLWTLANFQGTAFDGGIDWAEWTAQVETMLTTRRQPPFRETEPVPGIPGPPLLYASVFRFDRVVDARTAWELDRARLVRLLHICSALGLATATKERPAVLVLPRDLTLAMCQERLTALKAAYPDCDRTFTRVDLPDAAAPVVRQAARRQYRLLLRPAQAEVLRHLRQAGTGRDETPARWEPVRAWLQRPEELASWRELAKVLLRLDDPSAEEPVQALAAFLARTEFPLDIRTLLLEVPEVRGLRPAEEGKLVVLHPASGRQPALAFATSGAPRRETAHRTVVYTFRLVEGQKLTYRPGDKLWAELPLRGGKERLVWSESRSALYQFERLRQPPRLQAADAATLGEGRVFDDVTLTMRPDDGVPPVPDLLPTVQLE